MLTFKNTTIVFTTLMVLFICLHVTIALPLYLLVALFVAYSIMIFYGSYFVSSGFFVAVICRGNTSFKKIAITFDDGPAGKYTPDILALLEHHAVQAAFFLIGKRIKGNEHLVKAIHENGHLIGNHSFSHHFFFDFFSSKRMFADIHSTGVLLQEEIGLRPKFFRPPYGVTTPPMKRALEKGDYIPVGWNIRSMDTMIRDESKLYHKVTKALKPGAILLFHDTCKTTVSILPQVIEYAKKQGYEFVRLDELINKPAYA